MSGFYSRSEAAKMTGLSKGILVRLIGNGVVREEADGIPKSEVARLKKENEDYIGLYEYAKLHETERFNPESAEDRNKLYEEIEENHRFGLSVTHWKNLATGNVKNKVYFRRKDIPVLDRNLKAFFESAGYSAFEEAHKLIKEDKDHPNTKKYLYLFEEKRSKDIAYTPSYVDFVKIMLSAPDVLSVTTEDAGVMSGRADTVATKKYIIAFLMFVKDEEPDVKYDDLYRVKKEKESIPAYDNDTYVLLAGCFFGAKHIADNMMIEKALDDHWYAEMWLYHVLHYCCGLRAQDVCLCWPYAGLEEHEDGFLGVHKDSLYDDILNDTIEEKVYEDVCSYVLSKSDITPMYAGKTGDFNQYKVQINITPDIQNFFGLLTLIAEVHHMKTGEGYMRAGRANEYQNLMRLRVFYGEEIVEILHGENLQSKRLNKDFLQAVERTALDNGTGGVLASALASFARNHSDLNTIKHYLQDGNLTGEMADFVIYQMIQRGVFAVEKYKLLAAVFPDVMTKLTMKEQTRLMEEINMTPLAIEMAATAHLESKKLGENVVKGNTKQALATLRQMLVITQGKRKGKDFGIGCLVRAQGYACEKPLTESCITQRCPNLVFTRYGFEPLVRILKTYKDAADEGNKKAEGILNQWLLPEYSDLIQRVVYEVGITPNEAAILEEIEGRIMNGKE